MTYTGTIAYCSREDHWYPTFGRCLAGLTKRHPDAKLVHSPGNRIDEQRNACVEQMEGDWIFFLDTDFEFMPDLLDRLLSHHVHVVQAHVLDRQPPHNAIPHFGPYDGRRGLVEAHGIGGGGVLFSRTAMATIGSPWFAGRCGFEDLYCAEKLKAAGFTLWCDLETTIGHVTPLAVWPEWDDLAQRWRVVYKDINGHRLPQAQEPATRPAVYAYTLT